MAESKHESEVKSTSAIKISVNSKHLYPIADSLCRRHHNLLERDRERSGIGPSLRKWQT
jgi:hypothetical protein